MHIDSTEPLDSSPQRSRDIRSKALVRANVLLGFLLLAALILVVRERSDERRFAELARHAHPEWLLLGIALQLVTYVCAAAVWHRVTVRHTRVAPSLWSLVPLGFAKIFIDQVVPAAGIGGTMLVIRGLARRGVPRGIATAALLMDLVSFYAGHGTAVVLAMISLAALRVRSPAAQTAAALFGIVAIAVPLVIAWLNARGLRSLPDRFRRFSRVRTLVATLADAPPTVLRDRALVVTCASLQFAVVALDAATLGAMLAAVGHPARPLAVFASFTIASAVASVGLVPGAVGIFETTSVAMMRLFDVPLEAALAGTLLTRGLTLWLPLAPGFWVTRAESRARKLTQ